MISLAKLSYLQDPMSDRNFCLSATLPIENISRGLLYALHAARCSFFKDEWIGECIVLGVLLNYHSETIGMITMNIELILILIILLVLMGGMVSQWLAIYILQVYNVWKTSQRSILQGVGSLRYNDTIQVKQL